ncbi:hypothetical protein QMO56_19005 [Roseomonas sp. E05]|uniref:hypothetical protein n=1 Tax=Roseomonas sp. E05 TaxID=3046310 RepID=UPI0024B8823C|nr:hypothetical protein [Roseomonas sp. E05]MDJ0390204.1 hypothetical protein [Roseomonas sp. E05]
MKIELRKIDYSASLSEETNAFSAEVWIDGKKEGHAQNHGTGGPTDVHPNTLRARLDEYGKTLPKVDIGASLGGEPHLIVQDAEWIVGQLLDDWILLRDLRKRLKKRVLYVELGQHGIMQTKVLPPEKIAQILGSAEIKAKWRVETWLNSLPEEEALKLFRKHTGAERVS